MESIVIIDRRRITKWKNLKQRIGLKAMGCCGANWSPRARISTINSILDEDHEDKDEEEEEEEEEEAEAQRQLVFMSSSSNGINVVNNNINNHTEINNSGSTPLLLAGQQQGSGSTGMNLAMALAAERNLRGNNVGPSPSPSPSPTEVKTLMRLIEETEGVDWNNKIKKKIIDSRKLESHVNVVLDQPAAGGGGSGGSGGGGDWMCCVCMERKKGAAFIPCGHTFCRVCSREVWLNRPSCPVCNRPILDILHLF